MMEEMNKTKFFEERSGPLSREKREMAESRHASLRRKPT